MRPRATSLTWLSYLLCKHPEVYQKLQQEIDEVLAGCRVTYNDLEKLPYTRMVIDEALETLSTCMDYWQTAHRR
ncbi:MAG: cytochrome P450 [Deinococcales bacterium]